MDVLHGFEHRFEQWQVTMAAGQTVDLAVNLDEGTWIVPDAAMSADVHVHSLIARVHGRWTLSGTGYLCLCDHQPDLRGRRRA
jgi:hypothetical protein